MSGQTTGAPEQVKPFWETVFGQVVIGVVSGLIIASVVKK